MTLKNCDYLVSEGAKIIFNGRYTYLPGDICLTLEGDDLKKVQQMIVNPFSGIEEFPLQIRTTNGLIKLKVSDLLSML